MKRDKWEHTLKTRFLVIKLSISLKHRVLSDQTFNQLLKDNSKLCQIITIAELKLNISKFIQLHNTKVDKQHMKKNFIS